MNPTQLAAMQGIGGFQGGPGFAEQAAMYGLGQFAGGAYAQPGYLEQKEQDLIGTWKEDIMPELRGEMGRKGLFYGSGRQRAEGESAESLMDVLARGRVEEERYAREQQLGALGQMGGMAQTGRGLNLQEVLGVTGQQFGFGTTEQEAEQKGLEGKREDWLRTLPENQMKQLMDFLGTQQYSAYGPLQDVLGKQRGELSIGGEAYLKSKKLG